MKANAINLLKNLNAQLSELYDKVIKPHYTQLLINYKNNPKQNWKDKIIAINLIFSSIIEVFSTHCKYK